MASPTIAIVGAGPAGLLLARLLQINSIPCSVYERDAGRLARTQGGSLDLHEASAQLALREANLYDDFLAVARPEGEVLKIYDASGQLLLDEHEGIGVGRPKAMKNRPEIDRVLLRNLLLDSLEPKTVQWGKKLLRVTELDGQYNLHFTTSIESGFDLVIGADGAWSKVREAVSNQLPFYSGVGGLDLHLTDVDRLHIGVAKRVGQGMCLTLGENKGLLAQRNGDGGVRVYAFVRVDEEWYKDCNIDVSNPESAKKEMLDLFFSNWDPGAKKLVLESDPEMYMRPMYMLPVGFTWKHTRGVTLIGDAAHLMAPFAGVGVNLGMQDALDLARGIIAQVRSCNVSLDEYGESLNAAVEAYEQVMWARARTNAAATLMFLDLFFNPRGASAMIEYFATQHEEKPNDG